MALIGLQFQGVALGDDLRGPLQVFQPGGIIAKGKEEVAVVGQPESSAERLLAQVACRLVSICGGMVDRAVGGGKAVVINDQRPVLAAPVGVGEDILIHRAIGPVEVVQEKILALSEQPALMQQWGYLTVVALHQPAIGIFLVAGAAKLHAVLLGEALDLTMTK